jgi:hypothetical protein
VNLFIAGAAKAGTSSLWSALKQHPSVFAPHDELNKELCFFTPIASHIGLARYHSFFSEAGSERYLMDASTPYLTHPDAAQAIHNYNPEAKIIIVLRHPTSRAYSLYLWMVADGYEWAPSFEAALDLEDARAARPTDRRSMPQYFWNYMYRKSGLYYDQVQRFETLFGYNMLLVNFHDLVAQPAKQFERILDFLQLEKVNLKLERENPSMQVISPRLSFAARRLQQRVWSRLPARFGQTKMSRDFLLSLCTTNRRPAEMKLATRVALDAYFAADLARLRNHYGLNLEQTQ